MLQSVLSIFVAAAFAPLIAKLLKKSIGMVLAILPLILFIYFLTLYSAIRNGQELYTSYGWVESLGIQLTFYLDGLSLLFSLIILGIGGLVLIYSNGYMKSDEHKGRFYGFMLVFMGAMLGLVLSANLITLYVCWELTSISSFLLIGFHHYKKKARSAALQALIITEFGGLSLLAGFILLGHASGTYELTELLSNPESLSEHPLYLPLLILILIGAFTKSAQFPFHFWLPIAMKAPTPVSAYLHSAAMVNAGIYLLARLNPILGNTSEWQNIITFFGAATMLVGAYLSLTQKDLKAILAYVTISALGILVMLIGIGTFLSVKAALTYLIVHALYKATLFMVAGAIDKKTGTRNINELGGLYKKMPLTTATAMLALLSMAGLPPMLGYISKEFIYQAGEQAPGVSDYVLMFSVLSNIFMVAVSMIFAYKVFFKKEDRQHQVKEAGAAFWIGPAILATLSLVLALFPKPIEPLMEFALAAVKVIPVEVELKLWHGFNVAFLLSLVTVASGVLIFTFRRFMLPLFAKVNNALFSIEFAAVFNNLVHHFLILTKKHTSFFQHGYYRFYLMVVFIVAAGLIWYQLNNTWSWVFLQNLSPVSYYVATIAIAMSVAAIAAVFTTSRLVAIVIMGAVGFGVAVIYLVYGAVDLAITQVLVETLTLVLFVLVFQKLPPFTKHLSRSSKVRDAIIALSIGGFMAGLVLKSDHLHLSYPVSNYIAQNSYTEAHGKNIVNVILVDFRALDTMGEILVLAIASLGIFSLLKFKNNNI
ncbi:Na(+) H(+) antiporter subunit A [Fulvivirga imtechensis AK7]|uniref:Na(+) H(+) antiporter subunit A n=1 Tax=Fulvivirga imtechensis AK7 TaxID=1237149 RepID=L8JNN0_9BACT|nr:hydrogen gas-evolving membrane-bound hydrogenase subunit E [Fulvivirga imtechensis]ELR70450.1 Na(+) H(+) antiporter subunit A [Fulvivirga imtechensis AK7]